MINHTSLNNVVTASQHNAETSVNKEPHCNDHCLLPTDEVFIARLTMYGFVGSLFFLQIPLLDNNASCHTAHHIAI